VKKRLSKPLSEVMLALTHVAVDFALVDHCGEFRLRLTDVPWWWPHERAFIAVRAVPVDQFGRHGQIGVRSDGKRSPKRRQCTPDSRTPNLFRFVSRRRERHELHPASGVPSHTAPVCPRISRSDGDKCVVSVTTSTSASMSRCIAVMTRIRRRTPGPS
jgi:hypothetical protein